MDYILTCDYFKPLLELKCKSRKSANKKAQKSPIQGNKSSEFYKIQRNNLPKSDKIQGNPLLAVSEFGGGHPRLAAEVAAESSLFLEAQHVGNGLHREVMPDVQ